MEPVPPLVEVWRLHPRDPPGSACHLLSLRDQQRFPSTCSAGDLGSIPWVRKIPWRNAWQRTPVFWPGESHGQRSLAGCSPWGPKEPDMNQRLSTHTGKMCAFVGLCCYLSFSELILTSSALPSLYFWPDSSCFLPLYTEGHVIHSQPELKASATLVPIPHESKLVLFALCWGTGQGNASAKGTVVLIGISETMCSPLGTHSSAGLAVTPQIPAASAPPEPDLHAPRRPVSRTAICPLGPGRTWGCGVQSPFFLSFFFYFNKCYIKYTGQSTPFPCDGVHGSKIVPTLGHPFFRIYVKRRKFCLPGLFPSP